MSRLDRMHRRYVAARLAAHAIPRIIGGALLGAVALGLVLLGIVLAAGMPEYGLIALAVSAVLAISLAVQGAHLFFGNLPGITPRRVNESGGRSRLAERKELRRARII